MSVALMKTDALLAVLRQEVPGATMDETPAVDMPTVMVDRGHLLDVCATLRDHPALQFSFLADVTAVDHAPAEPRFELVYHLACVGEAYATGSAVSPSRLRVKVTLDADEPRAPSVVSVYPTAGWLEREVFDLFGIVFEGHPDLRRILMPDDWEGAPLRKDSPVQIRKTPEAWSPIQLTAEEFAENVRARREQATRRSRPEPGGARD